MKGCILYVHFIALLTFSYTAYAIENGKQDKNYLLKPTGSYGVGYQDIFLINTDVCPDAFYQKNINESDFSSANNKYCHEIALRVYYPSPKAPELSDEYYALSLIGENNWIVKNNKLSKQETAKLNTLLKIKTYTTANAEPIKTQKLPVIIFMAGAVSSAQTYNNIISNLVSNGYIVIGVNSLFINGTLQLSNGHVVSPPNAYKDEDGRRENISDLKFVLNRLTEIKYRFNLEKYMDFYNIGLIGHSRGAMSIVNLLKQNQNYQPIKSIILMDPGDLLMQANYPLPPFSIPTMIMWSSSFKKGMHGEALLGENNYEVILKPKGAKVSFSKHGNFSDKTTLQYHPAYQIPAAYQAIAVGFGNGYEIALVINDFVLAFVDSYLKNKHSKALACKDFNDSYLLKCGHQ